MFSFISGANLGSSNLSIDTPMAGDRDPHRKVKEMRFIGIADVCAAAISILFHTWIIILEIFYPEHINHTGQSDGVIYVGLSLLIISFGALIFWNWKFLNGLKQLSIKPIITIKDSTRWKNWSVFSLVVVIIILLTLVLSSGPRNLDRGSTQLYMVYLLCILAWRIYGIYRIGKFIDDTVCHTSGADNRIYYVPTPNALIK